MKTSCLSVYILCIYVFHKQNANDHELPQKHTQLLAVITGTEIAKALDGIIQMKYICSDEIVYMRLLTISWSTALTRSAAYSSIEKAAGGIWRNI